MHVVIHPTTGLPALDLPAIALQIAGDDEQQRSRVRASQVVTSAVEAEKRLLHHVLDIGRRRALAGQPEDKFTAQIGDEGVGARLRRTRKDPPSTGGGVSLAGGFGDQKLARRPSETRRPDNSYMVGNDGSIV